MTVAILYEDGNPIRAFKDRKCIYSAYMWARKNFCLDEQDYLPHQLPDYLQVKFFMMTEEQSNSLFRTE